MKYFLKITVFILFCIPSILNASSVSFSETKQSYQTGQTVSVKVFVSPDVAEKIYTAKIAIIYSPDILQLQSFTIANGWIPLQQSGYHETDTEHGLLIRTGGYTGGASNSVEFGTLSFTIRSAGQANIRLNGGEILLLDASNTNLFFDNNLGISFVTEQKIVKQTTPTAQTETAKKETAVSETVTEEKAELKEEPLLPDQIPSPSQAEIIVSKIMPHIYLFLLGVVSFILAYTVLVYILILTVLFFVGRKVYKKIASVRS